MNRPILTLLASMLAAAAAVAQLPEANPTRPAAGDNAFLTAPGHLEVESGLTIGDGYFTVPAILKASLVTNLEFGFLMSGVIDHVSDPVSDTDVGDPGIQAKYQFTRDERTAVSAVGRLDFTDPGTRFSAYVTPSLTPIVGRIDATFGFANLDGTTSLVYAAAFYPGMIDPLRIFGEIHGESAGNYSPIMLNGGLLYSLSPDFVVDAAVGFGLSDDSPDWLIQVGLTKVLVRLL